MSEQPLPRPLLPSVVEENIQLNAFSIRHLIKVGSSVGGWGLVPNK